MPLYFFDFMDGEFNGRDKFGTKLPDVEDAAREAVWALANISKDVRKQYQDRVLALNVRGQSGETVLNVTLTLAVTRFPDKQIECNQFRACGASADPDHVISTDQFSVTLQAPAGISDVHPLMSGRAVPGPADRLVVMSKDDSLPPLGIGASRGVSLRWLSIVKRGCRAMSEVGSKAGNHLLPASISHFDPVQTLRAFACEALSQFPLNEREAQACATFGVALHYFGAVIVPPTWEFSNGLENTEDR